MKTNKAKELTKTAFSQLEAELEAGQSETLKKCIEVMSNFRQYSFGNCLLIVHQKPNATKVAGFKSWPKVGRHVLKGEKGIAIAAPMLVKRKDPEDDNNPDDDFIFYKTVYVFDISQTEGEELPKLDKVTGDPSDNLTSLKVDIARRGITLEYTDNIGGATASSNGGRIKIRPGLEPANEFSVLVHELAHELLHHQEDQERPPHQVRETEAEAVAYIVNKSIGLDTGTANSDYIQLYQGSVDTLRSSLQNIRETSQEIMSNL